MVNIGRPLVRETATSTLGTCYVCVRGSARGVLTNGRKRHALNIAS
jgi:hypothetical protein